MPREEEMNIRTIIQEILIKRNINCLAGKERMQ